MCGSFTLERLFDFISAYSWLNGALYFSLKNLFCGKSFFNQFLLVFCWHNLFHKRKYLFRILYHFNYFFSVRIHNMGCYLYTGEKFLTIFNPNTNSIFFFFFNSIASGVDLKNKT